MHKRDNLLSEKLLPHSAAKRSPQAYSWHHEGPVPWLPEVSYLGYADLKEASPLTEHKHADSFEFVYIEKGKASWEINGAHYETKTGDLFHTLPDELHRGSYNIIEPCRLWAVVLRAPFVSESGVEDHWLQVRQSSDEISSLLEGLHKLPRVVFMSYKPLDAFRRLAKAVQMPHPLSRLAGRVAILDLLLQLLEASKNEAAEAKGMLWKIEKLTNELALQMDNPPAVEEMAARVGVGISYFYRLFQEYTHMTPRAYLERLRIKEACRYLTETEAPVTEIAVNLGFATSQHFATVFRRLTGRTPSEWREMK